MNYTKKLSLFFLINILFISNVWSVPVAILGNQPSFDFKFHCFSVLTTIGISIMAIMKIMDYIENYKNYKKQRKSIIRVLEPLMYVIFVFSWDVVLWSNHTVSQWDSFRYLYENI